MTCHKRRKAKPAPSLSINTHIKSTYSVLTEANQPTHLPLSLQPLFCSYVSAYVYTNLHKTNKSTKITLQIR
jgi:hypothetical protein